jgi:hypothetical protein
MAVNESEQEDPFILLAREGKTLSSVPQSKELHVPIASQQATDGSEVEDSEESEVKKLSSVSGQ